MNIWRIISGILVISSMASCVQGEQNKQQKPLFSGSNNTASTETVSTVPKSAEISSATRTEINSANATEIIDSAAASAPTSAQTPTSHQATPPQVATGKIQNKAYVTGKVSLPNGAVIPPNALVTITLADASLADAPEKVLSQQEFRAQGKVPPYAFSLPYNQAEIQPNQRINLSASVMLNDGQLIFITDTFNEVINHNKGTHKDLSLISVGAH